MGLSAKEYGLDPGILQFSQMRCLPRLGRTVLGWLGGWWVCVGGKGQGGSYDQETKTEEVGMARETEGPLGEGRGRESISGWGS